MSVSDSFFLRTVRVTSCSVLNTVPVIPLYPLFFPLTVSLYSMGFPEADWTSLLSTLHPLPPSIIDSPEHWKRFMARYCYLKLQLLEQLYPSLFACLLTTRKSCLDLLDSRFHRFLNIPKRRKSFISPLNRCAVTCSLLWPLCLALEISGEPNNLTFLVTDGWYQIVAEFDSALMNIFSKVGPFFIFLDV